MGRIYDRTHEHLGQTDAGGFHQAAFEVMPLPAPIGPDLENRIRDFCECLQYYFCQALAGAHDVGWTYGLVGTNQYEIRDAVFGSGLGRT